MCVFASVCLRKERENLCSAASLTKQMKTGNQFGENASSIPIFSNDFLHQLQKEKKCFAFEVDSSYKKNGNIVPCTKAWLVRLHSLYLALRILFCLFLLWRKKKSVQQRVGVNHLKKIKINVKQYAERHRQPVSIMSRRVFFVYFSKSCSNNQLKQNISISFLNSWF